MTPPQAGALMSNESASRLRDYTRLFDSRKGSSLSREERNELIVACTPLIKYIAARLASRLPPHISVDDLESSGVIGLIDAIEKFDPAKNVQFKTYAEFRIRGAMLDELRSLDWIPRSVRRKITEIEDAYDRLERTLGRPAGDEEVAAELGVSIKEFHRLLSETRTFTFMDADILSHCRVRPHQDGVDGESMEPGDPVRALNLAELREHLAHAIASLPEKERLVVSMYHVDELSMKEIGEVLGYTESRISQLHSKAMLRLRARLRKTLGVSGNR